MALEDVRESKRKRDVENHLLMGKVYVRACVWALTLRRTRSYLFINAIVILFSCDFTNEWINLIKLNVKCAKKFFDFFESWQISCVNIWQLCQYDGGKQYTIRITVFFVGWWFGVWCFFVSFWLCCYFWCYSSGVRQFQKSELKCIHIRWGTFITLIAVGISADHCITI